MKFRSWPLIAWMIVAGSLLAAGLLIAAPSLPAWGEYHQPHADPKNLLLSANRRIGQSFVAEYSQLDVITLWLDPTTGWPRTGSLALELTTNSGPQRAMADLANMPPSGIVTFQFLKPLPLPTNTTSHFYVSMAGSDKPVSLRYQIDATKYPDGELLHDDDRKQGDLAFQVRYRRPALGSQTVQRGYALTIVLAGLLVAAAISRRPRQAAPSHRWPTPDMALSFVFGCIITLFYTAYLLQPGWWAGPSDFVKDTSYVTASAAAIKSGTWPVWSHRICGGMPLLGNPEGNTISLATALALLLDPERALWLTLALEAGLGAAGSYWLARSIGASRLGSILTAVIYSLSGAYAYRLAEGFTMLGGPMAAIPWVFVGLQRGNVLLTGLALAFMFLRGDVHVVIGAAIIVAAWYAWQALRYRRWYPMLSLLGVAATVWLVGSIKILPYLEQPTLVGGNLSPYVAPLVQQGLLDDVFFKIIRRDVAVPVLHGTAERYGNFGAYIGVVPAILAAIGLWQKNRYRPYLLLGVVTAFLLSEGTLFEYGLRHIPPLDVLLRVPTRLLPLTILFLGLLAAAGLDKIGASAWPAKDIRRQSRHGSRLWRDGEPRLSADRSLERSDAVQSRPCSWHCTLTAIITAFVLIDLASAASVILTDNLWNRTRTVLAAPDQPALAPHANFSRADAQHAGTLLRAGYNLPHVCGDQNNPPEFLATVNSPTLMTTLPARSSANIIEVAAPPEPGEYRMASRFTSAVASDRGLVMPTEDGAINLIAPRSTSSQTITLRYLSATTKPQQLLTVVALVVVIGALLHRNFSAL